MRNIIFMAAVFAVVLGTGLVIFGSGSDEEGMQATGNTSSPAIDTASLIQARRAFWAGDIVSAEKHYRDISSADEGNTDAWGELGNIYFMQSRWQEAAAAYTEAALQFIEKGQLREAAYLHVLVIQMDKTQAARIDEQMRRAGGVQAGS